MYHFLYRNNVLLNNPPQREKHTCMSVYQCWMIQSFNDAALKNKEELIQAVSAAYESYLQNKINHTWLTLQCFFNQIIMHNGDNDYNIEHISKEKLEYSGQLPDVMMWWKTLMQAHTMKLMTNKHKHKHK